MNNIAAQNNKQLPQEKEKGVPVYFPLGLPGLGEYNRYRLQPLKDNPFFYFLQSVQDDELGFILIDPFFFFPGYQVLLSDSDKEDLKAEKAEDVFVFTTVTIAAKEKLTSNLAAPFLLNLSCNLGKQIIVSDRASDMQKPLSMPEETEEDGQEGKEKGQGEE